MIACIMMVSQVYSLTENTDLLYETQTKQLSKKVAGSSLV